MNKLMIFLKGLLMGACDVVPWVSGGTIAFITGIYERLIDSIHEFDMKAVVLFFSWKWKTLWNKIDWWFLFTLLLGIFVAIISFAKLIDFLLVEYPVQLRATFAGLLIASVVIIIRHIPKWTPKLGTLVVAWVVVGYVFTALPLLQTEPTLVSTFGAGAVAIMAMVLPGISWSYILLMLNHYQHIIGTLVSIIDGMQEVLMLIFAGEFSIARIHMSILPWMTVIVFALWAAIGVILFVKLLHWVKEHYHDELIAVLIGIMIGALHKVRPWKEAFETYVDRHGEIKPLIEANILPSTVVEWLAGFAFVTIGLGLVIGIEKLAKRK